MTLKIISSEKILFEGEVTMASMPGTAGRFTILPNHASIVSTLDAGNLTYRTADDEEHTQAINGGIVDVDRNVISVCCA